jgi:hypothetical protein
MAHRAAAARARAAPAISMTAPARATMDAMRCYAYAALRICAMPTRRMLLLLLLLLPPRLSSALVTAAAVKPPPHVFFVLVDDLGSADVGFTRFGAPPYDPSARSPTVLTPTMDRLAAEGVLLRRHYVHYVCTPTRSAVQTGRLPVHVQLGLANPASPAAGIPRNMTGLPDALRKAGAPYMAHLCGKWGA